MTSPTATRAFRPASVLAALAAALAAVGCASSGGAAEVEGLDPRLADLGWFVGVWQAGDAEPGEPRPVQIEHWQVLDDGSLGAANYQRIGDEVVPHQNLAVRGLGGDVVLEVTGYRLSGDTASPGPVARYAMTESGPDFARFEAAGLVPRAILYQRGPRGQMVISMVVPGDSGENELFVAFERVANG
jgi:hypothetical protein